MRKLTFISAFVLVAMQLIAQNSGLTVILNKGHNTHISANTSNSVLLGTTLKGDDRVTIGANGYMALLDKASGLTIELEDAGTYQVADLHKKLAGQPNSALSKYGKYLAGKLMPDDDNSQNLNVTGAVERGEEGFINVYFPKVTEVYSDQLLIAWQSVDDMDHYQLTIKNHRDEIVSRVRVKGNKYVLSFKELPYRDMKLLSFNIQGEGKSVFLSKDYGIKRMPESERRDIDAEFKNITALAQNDNVLGKLLIASFFEEHKLLADALAYYDQASTIAPDASGFNQLYHNFLSRNNLK